MLLGLAIAGAFLRMRALTCFVAACVGTALVYVGMGSYLWHVQHSLRSQFPYESMEARLLTKRPIDVPDCVVPVAKDLTFLETMVETRVEEVERRWNGGRNKNLERLHENAVGVFVNSPGFGVARMPNLSVSEESLQFGVNAEASHPQSVLNDTETFSPGNAGLPVAGLAWNLFAELHNNCCLDFVYPEGFGYFKDRAHVAAFRPHQFRKPPESADCWRVVTLELVGIAMHEQPVVYVSEFLPRMDELRKAPRRPLDTFETVASDDLRDGDTLSVRLQGDRLRMLGAIRATSQCVACHGCERGELLGAFSYALR
jgi:hypothetical protein